MEFSMRPVTTAITIAGIISIYLIGGTIYSLYKNSNKPDRPAYGGDSNADDSLAITIKRAAE